MGENRIRRRVAVFDLGGVLIDWNPRHLYRKLFSDEATMETFLTDICNLAWNRAQDAGRPIAEGVRELQARHPAQAELIAAYYGRWPEMLGGPIEASVAILKELKAQGTPLYALTNWCRETFPIARARFDFLDWFDGIVVSGEEGLVKPDPRIFELLFARYGFSPAETVFIDDSAENAAAGAALGCHGMEFTSPDALKTGLGELL